MYLSEQGVTTAIIARIAFAVCIWTLSQEIERLIAAALWTLSVYGSEKMGNGRLFIVAEDVDILVQTVLRQMIIQ